MKTCPSIERLECRIAPASLGPLLLELSGSRLTVHGNPNANSVQVTAGAAPGSFVVSSPLGSDSFKFNGVTATTQTLFGVGSLILDLGDGNDTALLSNLKLTGGVSILAGRASDSLTLTNVVSAGGLQVTSVADVGNDTLLFSGTVSFAKNVSLNLGAGDNTLTSSAALFSVGGKLSIVGGSGSDSIALSGASLQVGRDFSMTLGTGTNAALINAVSAVIGGAVTFAGKTGQNTLSLVAASGVVSGKISGSFGVGTATMEVRGLSVGGGISMAHTSGADSLSVSNSVLNGALSARLGDGVSTVIFVNAFAASVSLDCGAGADSFTMDDFRVTAGFSLTCGAGDDTLNLETAGSLAGSFIGGASRISLGSGLDTLQIGKLAMGALDPVNTVRFGALLSVDAGLDGRIDILNGAQTNLLAIAALTAANTFPAAIPPKVTHVES